MFSTLAARNDVIDRQVGGGFSAVLAGIVVPAQDLTFIQLDSDARSLDHALQADDRGPRKFLGNGVYKSAPVENQRGFFSHHQANRSPGGTDIQRLEVRIQYQYWFKHFCTLTLRIIAWLVHKHLVGKIWLKILYNEAMHTRLGQDEFKPEMAPRRGEIIAWAAALLVNGAWLLLILFDQGISIWLLVLGVPLLLVACGVSLANWIDRHTILKVDEAGITFSNGLRSVDLEWGEIQEVRVLPAQWGEKVQVFGEHAYFGFHTLGEVKSNGKLLGRTGFKDGDQILARILEKSGLPESKLVELGGEQEGYYYSRQ